MKGKLKGISVNFIIVFVIIFAVFLLTPGPKISSVCLGDYSISEEGSKLSFSVWVWSSMGYVKSIDVKEEERAKYITFYSTHGLNNGIGAKGEFEIDLEPSCEFIYFYKGNEEYKLILHKDKESNKWIK